MKQGDVVEGEDFCQCGHARSEHVMGSHYCMRGCFTTDAQAEYFAAHPELVAQLLPLPEPRATCIRFTRWVDEYVFVANEDKPPPLCAKCGEPCQMLALVDPPSLGWWCPCNWRDSGWLLPTPRMRR